MGQGDFLGDRNDLLPYANDELAYNKHPDSSPPGRHRDQERANSNHCCERNRRSPVADGVHQGARHEGQHHVW
eukprot:CAMPEP_0170185260 /NCGR_PEP_ID=MMETSP0040_2-20121228/36137_1 /TAXON_ID=641309 /ORGANISM="Lotharella oceanica, Strain CCMP622" /LENGTH=72 /DNA_ID=CAMNT_0010431613 /DNA_START=125 /DNA_END=340 /DNA_ORIENTATION=+